MGRKRKRVSHYELLFSLFFVTLNFLGHFQKIVSREVREERFNHRSEGFANFDQRFDRFAINENNFSSQQKLLEMQNRIQTLELELSNYRNERGSFEQRISFEQKRVIDLSAKIQSLRSENEMFRRERIVFEEKTSQEGSKISQLQLNLEDKINENALLLAKVTHLEETLKSERYSMEIYSEKFKSSLNASGRGGNNGLEDRIRSQQQRIYELESLIEGGSAETESLQSQLSSYESTIELQKMQVDNILKKFHGANADNEFLVKKLHLLSQTLSRYQFEVETMSGQLQNAKAIISQLHGELARANAAVAKYQAAMASAYMLNGELMTKVTSFSTLTQYQSSSESKLDILGLNMSRIEASSKQAVGYKTSELLEATGSETYLKFIKSESKSGNFAFQSLGAETATTNGGQAFTATTESL